MRIDQYFHLYGRKNDVVFEEVKWIPVSEALPKDMDRLLATIVRSDGSKRVRSGHYYNGLFMMDNGDTWKETDKGILAWMSLPEIVIALAGIVCALLMIWDELIHIESYLELIAHGIWKDDDEN